MLDRDLRRRPLERKHASREPRRHRLGRTRQRERAQPGEQVGGLPCFANRFTNRRNQRRLAVLGRLEEARRPGRPPGPTRSPSPAPAHRTSPAQAPGRGSAAPDVARRRRRQRLDRLQPFSADALEHHVDALVGQRQLHFGRPPRLEQRPEQRSQRRDQREQFGPQDVASRACRRSGATCAALKPSTTPFPIFSARRLAAAGCWAATDAVRGSRSPTMLRERTLDPRHEIAAIGFVVGMLQLAPAALGKVTAWRLLVMRPENDAPSSAGVAGDRERRRGGRLR